VVKDDPPAGGDDDLMDFDMGPPKRAPPKGIGVKPKKKAKPADDEDMQIDSPPKKAPAKRGPPQLSSDKPKTIKSSTKGPTAPVIEDEDLGTGLDKDQAIDKFGEYFP